ncbi:HisA/HisF-related TIM barrel protein [Streptomyces sp. NPDC048196]|uniref:HisA/HisF-related TIM barrel protein n=1 Tax=Streptomyces sp. NPDC048196 TaxID=3154712 RepID=UPI003400137F
MLAALDGAGCARYVVTDVSREGSLTGANLSLLQEVCVRTPAAVLAAGGITTLADLKTIATLQPMGVEGALIGRTLRSADGPVRHRIVPPARSRPGWPPPTGVTPAVITYARDHAPVCSSAPQEAPVLPDQAIRPIWASICALSALPALRV